MITSKHWGEGWIVIPSYPLPSLLKESQSNKSMQQYNIFDTYYDSWVRVPLDLSKRIKSLKEKEQDLNIKSQKEKELYVGNIGNFW